MPRFLSLLLAWFSAFFSSRNDLGLEIVALRHQLAVLKRKNPRPKLTRWDRLFWLTLRRLWVKMGERAADRKAGDRRGLASRRLPVVLALPFSPSARPSENHGTASETHSVDGNGKSDLGSSRDSW
jgi:hypothetical protein